MCENNCIIMETVTVYCVFIIHRMFTFSDNMNIKHCLHKIGVHIVACTSLCVCVCMFVHVCAVNSVDY